MAQGQPLQIPFKSCHEQECYQGIKRQDSFVGRPGSLCSHHGLRHLCPFSVGKVFLYPHFSILCETSLLEKRKGGFLLSALQKTKTKNLEARNTSYLLKIKRKVKNTGGKSTQNNVQRQFIKSVLDHRMCSTYISIEKNKWI